MIGRSVSEALPGNQHLSHTHLCSVCSVETYQMFAHFPAQQHARLSIDLNVSCLNGPRLLCMYVDTKHPMFNPLVQSDIPMAA